MRFLFHSSLSMRQRACAWQGGSEKNCVTVNRLVIEDQAFGLQPVGHTVSAERLFSGQLSLFVCVLSDWPEWRSSAQEAQRPGTGIT